MTNYVKPEWLPTIPENDTGPFFCYIFWAKDTREYYVGHTGDIDQRTKEHLNNRVKTTAGHDLRRLWVSDKMPKRSNARRFEAALKSYIKAGNATDFKRTTGKYLVKGAKLLEANPTTSRRRRR